MHARVITGQIQLDKLNEAIELYREVLSASRQQPGFKETMMLIDRSTGKGITISLWQTEAEAQASGVTSSYLQAQLKKFASFLVAAPTIETYEVAAQE